MRSAPTAPRWRATGPRTRCPIRQVTVGHVHAQPGDPLKLCAMHGWLQRHPGEDLPPLRVTRKLNGTYRIYDGRHRFLSYVLAAREDVPIVVGELVGVPVEGEGKVEALGVTVTIDRSCASDGAPVVFVDTDEELEGDTGSPGPRIRIRLNDEPVYIGVAHGAEPDQGGT